MRRQIGQRHDGLVFHRRQQGVVERAEKHVLDQVAHGLAATAVRHVDGGVAHLAAARADAFMNGFQHRAHATTARSGLRAFKPVVSMRP